MTKRIGEEGGKEKERRMTKRIGEEEELEEKEGKKANGTLGEMKMRVNSEWDESLGWGGGGA